MLVLVTGVGGFTGRHLVEHLGGVSGLEVVGVDRQIAEAPGGRFHGDVCDLTDGRRVRELIGDLVPDVVFHLADPAVGARASAVGGVTPFLEAHQAWYNILEAVRSGAPQARVLLTSSSAVYGPVPEGDTPIAERRPPSPVSQQGVAKCAQEMLAASYFACHGTRTLVIRPFNLVGPGLSDAFVSSAIARQVAEIASGRRERSLRLGNLTSVRDYVDVRDAVEAYWLLADRGTPGQIYNVATGRGHSVRDIAITLSSLVSSGGGDLEIIETSSLRRACDIPLSIGSFEKLREATGWSPTRPLDRSMQDLMQDWVRRLTVD